MPYTQFSVYWLLVLVDINGQKGPNKWGHDLFMFNIKNKNGSYVYEANSGVEAEDGGLNTGQMLEEAFK